MAPLISNHDSSDAESVGNANTLYNLLIQVAALET
jgi:hypothetical protein